MEDRDPTDLPTTDVRSTYDAMRAGCPVAHADDAWLVLGHAEVVQVANDPRTFSSALPNRRAIPNSLDGEEHTAYRAIVDRYLTRERVTGLEPRCRAVADHVVGALTTGTVVEVVAEVGEPYAVRAQSAWLGWPVDLEGELVSWIHDNRDATRSGVRARTAEVAERFDDIIRALLDARRGAEVDDVTAELMRETVHGRALTDDEVVSILRNWTSGDLGSLAMSVGVVVHHLATHPDLQDDLRARVAQRDDRAVESAIEEILRIDDPFVASRRRTTRPVDLGGQQVPEGARVVLSWTAANRDPAAMGDPDRYAPAVNASHNLVFGSGPHVCPGRALTLMELRVVVGALLRSTSGIEPAADRPALREQPPFGGWAQVPVLLRR